MARPREFDKDLALEAAIGVFREHGYEGTSASMLVDAMKIGRQSLYDTFGDKWQLYCAALSRYASDESAAHIAALATGLRAIDGLRALMDRVADEAGKPCLGVSSIWEFGRTRRDVTDIRTAAGRTLFAAIATRIRQAQAEGDLAPDLDPEQGVEFLTVNIGGLRIAARDGAGRQRLRVLARLALRALER